MPATELRDFLDTRHIKFVSISHSKAFTSQEVAESAHISGREVAKTVIVKLDDKLAMAVLPASLMSPATVVSAAKTGERAAGLWAKAKIARKKRGRMGDDQGMPAPI